jgi:hypothetical protein
LEVVLPHRGPIVLDPIRIALVVVDAFLCLFKEILVLGMEVIQQKLIIDQGSNAMSNRSVSWLFYLAIAKHIKRSFCRDQSKDTRIAALDHHGCCCLVGGPTTSDVAELGFDVLCDLLEAAVDER